MKQYLRPIRHWFNNKTTKSRSLRTERTMRERGRSFDVAELKNNSPNNHDTGSLMAFFASRTTGAGIWKWKHYFPVYERHIGRFENSGANLLEVGIYSGGSLDMWSSYLGQGSMVYGCDIEPACTRYERSGVRVIIGDQGSSEFWKGAVKSISDLSIAIDDGGHLPEQQIATFEALVPQLLPGGVYICEDIHGEDNPFLAYLYGLSKSLCHFGRTQQDLENPARRIVCPATSLQQRIKSVHIYPFIAVVEINEDPIAEFVAPKHGDSWEPFLT